MAKAGRKNRGPSLKVRLWLVGLVVAAFVAGTVAILHFTGIMPVSEMLWRIGFRDKPAKSADVEVHFLDVEQGDCTLVMSQGETMLIDCGPRDNRDAVKNYLTRHGISRIDKLIVTHPHADHIGELWEILEEFEVDQVIMPRFPEALTPLSKSYERFLATMYKKGMTIDQAEDTTFMLGLAEVEIITSPLKDNDKLNNYSALVKITHGDNTFLVAADCEKEEELALIEKGADLRAKVLKVGHHGGAAASSVEFLDHVLPRYAVISCGADNDYGHPSKTVTDRLRKYADRIYITAETGTVSFISDGKGLTVRSELGGEE